MNTIRQVLVCILLAALIVAAIFGALLLRNSNKSVAASSETMAMLNAALKGKHKNGDDGLLVLSRILLQNADGAANALKQTLQDANKIAKSQEKKTDALSDSSLEVVKEGGEALKKFGTSIDALNRVIGDVKTGTLPKLDAGVDELNGLVKDLRPTAKASTGLLASATGDLDALHDAIDAANMTLADPDIADTIHSFKLMADTGVDTMKHADGAVTNTEQLAGEFRDMFKPAGKTSFFETLAISAAKSVLGPMAGSLVSHFWPVKVELVH
jgi:hypothetical protein